MVTVQSRWLSAEPNDAPRSQIVLFTSRDEVTGYERELLSSNLYLVALVRHSATSSILRPQNPGGDSRSDSSLINKIPVDLYRQRLKAFVHICRDFGIQPFLMTELFSSSTNSLTPAWINRTAQDRFNTVIRVDRRGRGNTCHRPGASPPGVESLSGTSRWRSSMTQYTSPTRIRRIMPNTSPSVCSR